MPVRIDALLTNPLFVVIPALVAVMTFLYGFNPTEPTRIKSFARFLLLVPLSYWTAWLISWPLSKIPVEDAVAAGAADVSALAIVSTPYVLLGAWCSPSGSFWRGRLNGAPAAHYLGLFCSACYATVLTTYPGAVWRGTPLATPVERPLWFKPFLFGATFCLFQLIGGAVYMSIGNLLRIVLNALVFKDDRDSEDAAGGKPA